MRDMSGLTLDEAMRQHREGFMTEAEWEAYAHAWQTEAPRFVFRVCECSTSCVAKYPAAEYRRP